MVEAFGLAASILGVAELGLSVTQSLYRFTVSYRDADWRVEEIEGRVSVTATILKELHSTVKSNEQYFKRNPTGALEAPVSSCRRDYKRLKDAVDEAKIPHRLLRLCQTLQPDQPIRNRSEAGQFRRRPDG